MEIKINSILILNDDKEYLVISKINYKGKTYLYIVEKDNLTNIKICELIGNNLIDVEDEQLIRNILLLFYKEARKNYNFN